MLGFLFRFLKVLATAAILALIVFVIQAAFIYYSLPAVNSTAAACWSADVGETCDLTVPPGQSIELADIGGEYFTAFIRNKNLYRANLRDKGTGEERLMILFYFNSGDGQLRAIRYQ